MDPKPFQSDELNYHNRKYCTKRSAKLGFVGLKLDRVSLAQKNKRAMSFLKLADLVFIEVMLKPSHVVK